LGGRGVFGRRRAFGQLRFGPFGLNDQLVHVAGVRRFRLCDLLLDGVEGLTGRTFDDVLEELYLANSISKEEAMAGARNASRIEALRRKPSRTA
jgi:hypothetical protein